MEELLGFGGGLLAVVLFLVLVAISILWIILPFAVFGVKGRLDGIRAEAERTNELLTDVIKFQKALLSEARSTEIGDN